MNDILERHFDTAFAAPDGIKKLRELILTLAMQGKLVPQDHKDPPASELLKQIAAEKQRLVQMGKIKEPKSLPEIEPEEVQYRLPKGWELIRFRDLAIEMATGPFGSIIHKNDYVIDGIPLINPSHMIRGFIVHDSAISVSPKMAKKLSTYKLYEGDIVMARRGEMGRCAIVDAISEGFLCGTGSFVLRFISAIDRHFILHLFQTDSVKNYLGGNSVGTTMTNLNHGILNKMPVSLPPLPEQHRIVAKVEQLMARCDELEKLRHEREQKRLAVHAAAIKQLLDAQEKDSFTHAWQFLTRHFGEIYTVKENIAELRKAILQLAVMGKLVPQNPTDPPASQLLKEIEKEKQRLSKLEITTKPEPLVEVRPEQAFYEIPESWAWVRLGDISIRSDSGWSPQCGTEARVGIEWGVLKVSAVSWGKFNPSENKAFPKNHEPRPECEVQPGDFLISRANTDELVARSVIVDETPPKLMMSDKIVRFALSQYVNKAFINAANSSSAARMYYISNASGTSSSMKNISRKVMTMLPIPLPPLPEQHRIVAKVDQLMSLCDALEQQIEATTGKQTEILNAVMAQV